MGSKKRRYKNKLLVLCILFSFMVTTCGANFSLQGRTVAEPDNPLSERLEDDKQFTASTLEEYLPESQQKEQEREEKREDEEKENSDEDKKADKEGEGDAKKESDDIKEGDKEGKNWFTTTITDGEVVTMAAYEFEIIQLQSEVPLVNQQIYLNGEIWPGFQNKGVVTLVEGDNTIKVTCTYEPASGEEFSVSRTYTVILDSERIIIYTDLEDGITVSQAKYSFTAYAKYQGSDVPVTVSLNGKTCSSHGENIYSVKLKDGSNEVIITAKSGDMTEEAIYKVTLDLNQAVIVTDLDERDLETDKEQFSFYASIMQSDESLKELTVKFNGKTIEDIADFEYTVTLKEGINTIVLDPSKTNPDVESQTYEVAYYKPADGLEVRTDLEEGWESPDPSFTFLAYAMSGQGKARLTVKLENKVVKEKENHYYKVTLSEGENLIHLFAEDGVEELSYTFSIYYNPIGRDDTQTKEDDDDSGEEENPFAPTLQTTLVDGSTIRGRYKNFSAWAYDYNGNRLGADYILVRVNGSKKNASLIWDDGKKTSYRLELTPGENKVTFTIVDMEGNMAEYQYILYSEAVGKGESIGTVMFSLEADVLCLDYLIPPTKVEIYEGDTSDVALRRFLNENGFECISTGAGAGFYLAGVGSAGLFRDEKPMIASWANGAVSSSGGTIQYNYEVGYLREKDFGPGSGWMFTINDEIPNYGFGSAYLEDGDVVRVRYTLGMGKDLDWDM